MKSDRLSGRLVLGALALGAALAVLGFGTLKARAETSEATITFSNLNLTTGGAASWDYEISDPTYAVDKFQLRLSRERNGKWTESYRTYTTSDDSYDITFTSTGRYYFSVRAKLVGGTYGDWSDPSNEISVTSDDIDYVGSGNTGAYGIGPGSTTATSGTIGPGGSTTAATQTASGWIHDSKGYRYYYANGTYMSGGWDYIDGYWYYFGSDGYMQVGWLYYGNQWYYLLLGSGKMAASSWNNINDKWYYFNESGVMQTGYIEVDGKTYYTDSSGARVSGTYNPDGHYFDADGVMIS